MATSVRILVLLVATFGIFAATVETQRPRFYPDDPIAREPASQDASGAASNEIEDLYEMGHNLFVTAGDKPSGTRARNINTIDEVPDSNWFTNRIGTTTITADQIARGPLVGAPPDPSRWVLVREKTAGAHPGFTVRDAKGRSRSRRRSSGRSATTRSKAI
jgi:hypothetical protein